MTAARHKWRIPLAVIAVLAAITGTAGVSAGSIASAVTAPAITPARAAVPRLLLGEIMEIQNEATDLRMHGHALGSIIIDDATSQAWFTQDEQSWASNHNGTVQTLQIAVNANRGDCLAWSTSRGVDVLASCQSGFGDGTQDWYAPQGCGSPVQSCLINAFVSAHTPNPPHDYSYATDCQSICTFQQHDIEQDGPGFGNYAGWAFSCQNCGALQPAMKFHGGPSEVMLAASLVTPYHSCSSCSYADANQQVIVAVRNIGGQFGISGAPFATFGIPLLSRVTSNSPFTDTRFDTLYNGDEVVKFNQQNGAGGCMATDDVHSGLTDHSGCSGTGAEFVLVPGESGCGSTCDWVVNVGITNHYDPYPYGYAMFAGSDLLLYVESHRPIGGDDQWGNTA